MIARRQVADLNNNMKDFERGNAQLVVIGNGPEEFITPFREATRYKGPLFTDPSLTTHDILGFKKGVTSLIGFNPLKAGSVPLAPVICKRVFRARRYNRAGCW
jgi:hypothetical protein